MYSQIFLSKLYSSYIKIGLFFMILVTISCNPKQKKSENTENKNTPNDVFLFDLNNPKQKINLPEELQEISGLSFSNENELMCVNDEKAKLYTYNLVKKEITNTFEFGKNGDFEGIEIVNNIAYALRSDGQLTAINLQNSNVDKIDCKLKEVLEYEGLGYESTTNSLLLVSKEMQKKKDNNGVYSYNLGTEKFIKKFEIDPKLISENSHGNTFKPSAIAVHPITHQIYLLASAGKKMIIISASGELISQHNLDSDIFKQPEGICFAPNGKMYISSEGVNSEGYILEFEPK